MLFFKRQFLLVWHATWLSKAFLRLQIAWENIPRCRSTILVAGWQWILAVPWLCLLAEPSSSPCLCTASGAGREAALCSKALCFSALRGVEPNMEPFWKGKAICGRCCKPCQAVSLASCCFWAHFILDQFYHLGFRSWSKRSRKRCSERDHGL